MTSKFSGFTLIEVLTVSGIMALFSITLISILLASFRGGTKSQLLQRMRQDGDYVLTSISRDIKRVDEIINIANCEAPGGVGNLQLTLADGNTIEYSLLNDPLFGDRIASDSGYLTGRAGEAEDLSFSCIEGQTGNTIVTISFSLVAGGGAGSQAQEKLSQEFATSVSTRQH